MNVKKNQNLTYCYRREIKYWETIWQKNDKDIQKRLDEKQLCHCPDFILNLIAIMHQELGRKPKVMDFGCGPFSNINYIYKKGLADLIGVDVLAEEYLQFYAKYGIDPPIPLISCSGESLSEKKFGNFDLVFVQNALDHTASPFLTWFNLYKVTKTGGYIGHCHAIKEATYQNKDQLHQYDLYAENSKLMIDDLDGQNSSMTEGLSLEIVYSSQFEVAPDKITGHKRPEWFCQIYKKLGESSSPEFLLNVIENLKKSFIKRSNWAMELENICLTLT
jgi:SAM-dependent methyltransferase